MFILRSLLTFFSDSFLGFFDVQHLNTNHILYAALKKAEQDSNLLTKEASRTVHHLRMDVERGGIHLDTGLLSIAVDSLPLMMWLLY